MRLNHEVVVRSAERLIDAVGIALGFGDDKISVSMGAGALSPEEAQASIAALTSVHLDGFSTFKELERECEEQPVNYVVEGLLPADDVHIAVGDSGLGKTPWAYQLGLCVSAGIPFLGHDVRQGRVLYFDLENGREEILGVGRSICGFLGLKEYPSDFFVLQDNGNAPTLTKTIEESNPALVIVDT